jgi:hypothetical protein
MSAVTYDFIKRLEQAGFTPSHVEVLASFPTETVTKTEFMQIESEIKNEIKQDIQDEIKAVNDKIDRAETRLEKRMDERFTLVDKRLDAMDKRFDSLHVLLRWQIGTTLTIFPAIAAGMFWFSHFLAR